jgi:hypothetical protein
MPAVLAHRQGVYEGCGALPYEDCRYDCELAWLPSFTREWSRQLAAALRIAGVVAVLAGVDHVPVVEVPLRDGRRVMVREVMHGYAWEPPVLDGVSVGTFEDLVEISVPPDGVMRVPDPCVTASRVVGLVEAGTWPAYRYPLDLDQGRLADAEALDLIAYILSDPERTMAMLAEIVRVVQRTRRNTDTPDARWPLP